MTDLAKVGFSADTAPLQTLNDQLDTTKDKVRGLNDEMAKTNAAAAGAATGLNQVGAAAQNVKNSAADTAISNVGQGLAKVTDATTAAATGLGKTADATKSVSTALDQNLAPSLQRSTGFLSSFKQAFTDGFNNAISQANAPIAQAGQVTRQLEDYVKATGLSYEQAAEAMKKVATAETALNTTTKDSGGFFNTLKTTVAGFAQSLTSTNTAVVEHTAKAKEMGEAHRETESAAKELRETMHTLEGPLDALGLQFSTVSQFSGAARAGMLALAASIAGTVLVELQKLTDESKTLETRLQGLAGVHMGEHIAQEFETAVKGAEHLPAALAPALEALIKLQQQNFDPHVIQAAGKEFESVGVSAQRSIDAVQSLYESIRLGGASSAQAVAATTKFFQDLQTQGKVTEQTFRSLQDASPATAQAIANIFTQGRMSATQFATTLKDHPIEIQKVVSALQKMKDANDDAYNDMIESPKDLESALEKLKGKFIDLTKPAQDSLFGVDQKVGMVTEAINLLADGLDELNTRGLPGLKQSFDLATNASKSWGDMIKVVDDQNSIFGKSLEIDVVGAIEKALIELGNFATRAPQAVTDFVSQSLTAMGQWGASFVGAIQSGLSAAMTAISNFVSSATAALQSVANAVSNIASAGGGTGNNPFVSATNNYSSPGAGTGDQLGSGTPADEGLAGFATGGSFTVGGSGGTDSQLIQFMATPGEQVTIEQPGTSGTGGGAPQTLGSLIPTPGTGTGGGTAADDIQQAKFVDALKTQTLDLKDSALANRNAIVATINTTTAQIVAAIKTLVVSSGVAASTSTTSSSSGTSASSSSSSVAPNSTVSSAAGGGGGLSPNINKDGQFGSPWNIFGDDKSTTSSADQQASRPINIPAPQQSGLASGRGGLVKGGTPGGAYSVGPDGNMTPFVPGQQLGTNGLQAPTPEALSNQIGNGVAQAMAAPPLLEPGQPGQGWEVAKGGADVKEQTQTLKQSQDTGSKTVADKVTQQIQETKTIGDKSTSSLDKVSTASQDAAKASDETAKATDDGNQQAKTIGDDTTKSIDDGTDATKGVGDTTRSVGDATQQSIDQSGTQVADATNTGSSNIVNAVEQMASSVASAIGSALAQAASSQTASPANDNGNPIGSSGGGGDIGGGTTDLGSSNPGGGDTTDNSGGAPGGFATGGQFSVGLPRFATGNQFMVKGPGHADTELIQFMASPGETITITPPGGTPPPNPTMDSHPNLGRKSGYATGGQTTLGGLFGTPSMPDGAANDLVAAHVADSINQQNADIGSKISDMTLTLLRATNDSTDAIVGKIASMASSLPMPAPASSASSSSSAPAPSSSSASSGLDFFGRDQSIANAILSSGGTYGVPIGVPVGGGILGGPSGLAAPTRFATGGQFSVGTTGLRGFATGGQTTVGGDTGPTSSGSIDALTATLDHRQQNQTLSIKDSIGASTNRISQTISNNASRVTSGLDALSAAINASIDAVRASSRASSTPSSTSAASSSGSSSSDGGLLLYGRDPSIAKAILASGGTYGTPVGSYQTVLGLMSGKTPGNGGGLYGFATGGQFQIGAGNMAEGGAFTVPGGQSGSDSVDVAIKASPGEKIFVVPPQEASKFKAAHDMVRPTLEPIDSYLPRPMSVPGNDNATATQAAVSGWKGSASYQGEAVAGSGMGGAPPAPVIIQVQQGVQADDFIRSRAQIQRAMNGK